MMGARTTTFYMANLGSELLRMLAARERNDEKAFRESARRSLALADSALAREHARGREEILTLKKIINDFLGGEARYAITKKEIESYFFPFAIKQMEMS